MLSQESIKLFLFSFKLAYFLKVLPFYVDKKYNRGKGGIQRRKYLGCWRAYVFFIAATKIEMTIFIVWKLRSSDKAEEETYLTDVMLAVFYAGTWMITMAIHLFYAFYPNISMTYVNSLIFLNTFAGNTFLIRNHCFDLFNLVYAMPGKKLEQIEEDASLEKIIKILLGAFGATIILGYPGITIAVQNSLPYFRLWNRNDAVMNALNAHLILFFALCDFCVAIPMILSMMLNVYMLNVYLLRIQRIR